MTPVQPSSTSNSATITACINRFICDRRAIIALLLSLFEGEPTIDVPFEQIKRQRPVVENRVMKLSNVEARSKFPRRPRPQFLDLQLAELISQRLAGPDDVTINLDDDVVFGLRRVRFHEINRLFAAPPKR